MNKILSRIVVPTRQNITEWWDTYVTRNLTIFSLNRIFLRCQIREDEIGGLCITHGDMKNAYKILVRNPKKKRIFGRRRHSWDDNIRIIWNKQGVTGWTLFDLCKNRSQQRNFVYVVINPGVPYKEGYFSWLVKRLHVSFFSCFSCARWTELHYQPVSCVTHYQGTWFVGGVTFRSSENIRYWDKLLRGTL